MDWVKIPAGALCVEPSGIVHLRISQGAPMDEATASDMVSALDAFNPAKAPLLCDIGGIAWVDKDARDLIASAHYARARAIVVRDSAAGVIAQLFENLHHPQIETRVFTDENEARAWLKTFLD